MRLVHRFFIPSVLLALTTAYAGGGPAPAPTPSAGTVESLIGDASCDTDAQCRTVAVGAKACGGPAAYLPWSSRQTDGNALKIIALREATRARAQLEKSGVMSNCSIVSDPGAYCAAPATVSAGIAMGIASQASTARRCQLRPSGNSGATKIY